MSADEGRVDEGRVSARLDDDVEAHGRMDRNIEPTDEAEDDEVEAHGRFDSPRVDTPRVD